MKSTKFRLKKGDGAVSSFTDADGETYLPGDVVELPAAYKGEAWLEQVEPDEKKPKKPPAKETPVAGTVVDAASLPEKKPRKTHKRTIKSES